MRVAIVSSLILISAVIGKEALGERRSDGTMIPRLSAKPLDEMRATARSLDLLRKTLEKQNRGASPSSASLGEQAAITMQQASMLIALGQAYTAAQKKDQKKEDERALTDAREILSGLLKWPKVIRVLNTQQLARVHRLRGMAAYYSDQFSGALQDFEESLKHDSASPESLWAAFLAAEEHFEQGNFKRAEELYRTAVNRTAKKSRLSELSRYKIGWCFLNINQSARAEAMFLDLAISAQDEALGLDSARDLAFIMARTYPEAKTLEVYDQKLTSTGERGKAFLKKALSAYESQGSLGTQSKLRERVLAVEDSAEARSTILLESIQGVSKEYASIAHAQRVLEVLASIHLIPDSKKGSLEAASERVCRIFSETYAGRVRTPEKIEKPILALTLKKIFREHLKAFPKSKKKALFYKNWLDVCELEKDALCLVRVSDEFLAESISAGAKTSSEPNSATIAAKARAMDARLLGLELLQSGPDSAKYRKRFTDELSARLADPSASNGDLAGAKLAQLQIEEKNISGALSTLETVFKRAPSHEHWYRLKWAQLQNKDYQSVLHGPEVFGIQQISGSPDPRLNAVMAEAALGMAEIARKSGDLDTMGKSIERFETVSSDQSKVQIARDEWIGAFVEKKSYIEALGQMQRFPDSWHQRAEADLWKKLVLVSLIEKGEHEQAEVLLKIWPETRRTALEPQLDLMVRLYFSGARAVEYQRVHSLGENQRLVWLSTAVVSQPGWTLNYFSRFPAKSGEEKSILRLAYKFLGKEDPLDPARLEHERMAKKTTFELAVAQVAIPSQSGKNKLSLQKYTQLLQQAISQVKLRREEMVPALKGQPAEVQLRIIESQRGLEGSIAKAILGSPVPGTLKGAELEQYRNGLQELAQEYQAQIQELEKASAKIEEQQKELRLALEKQEGEKTLPALKNSDGLIPDEYTGKDSLMRNVLRMARSGNSWGALIEIERLRTKKQIEGLDFWRMRSWILARSESPFLLRYLYDELQDAQANEVISKWKELAK